MGKVCRARKTTMIWKANFPKYDVKVGANQGFMIGATMNQLFGKAENYCRSILIYFEQYLCLANMLLADKDVDELSKTGCKLMEL